MLLEVVEKMKHLKTSLFLQFKGFLETPHIGNGMEFLGFPQFQFRHIEISNNIFDTITIPPKLILGKRMEIFFLLYLNYFSDEEVLAHSIQIISEKITVGELDFLLKNKSTGKISHVELVYKFYLYDPDIKNKEDRWVGPNRTDSLLNKCKKLKNQQFPLLFKPETKSLLRELELSEENIQQKICFKAMLFVPFPLLGKSIPSINNFCVQGFWIPISAFTASIFGGCKFFFPHKVDWPVAPENGTVWYSYEETRRQLLSYLTLKKSHLLWMKKNNKTYSRFFVVDW